MDPDLNGPSDIQLTDARIKASRCSINKKSKHNTNSIRVTATVDNAGDEEIDSSLASLIKLDPRLVHLKKRLQNKRDLMRHLQKMLSSFSGDTECLYREAEPPSSRLTSHGSNPPEIDLDRFIPRNSASSNGSGDGFTKTTTVTLTDYYMLPGVEWSLLKKGETVEVLGKLTNGWYRCRAIKDTSYELEDFPTNYEEQQNEHQRTESTNSEVANSELLTTEEERDELATTPNLLKESREDNTNLLHEITSSFKENSIPNEMFTNTNGDSNGINGETIGVMTPDGEGEEENDEVVEKDGLARTKSINMAYDNPILDSERLNRGRTDSYMIATMSDPVGTFRRQNLFRKDSYNSATGSGRLVDSIELTHNVRGTSPLPEVSTTQEYELKRLRINNILDHEKANNRYMFPLVGLIPASVLQSFETQTSSTNLRPSSSTSDYCSSGPVMDDTSISKSSTFNGHIKASSFDATSNGLMETMDLSQSQDEAELFATSMESGIANYPVPTGDKELQVQRKHSDRSMSLPTASLFPSGFTGDSVSERFSPELMGTMEGDTEVEEIMMEKDNEDNADVEEHGPKLLRRRSSKKMSIIPSPTSTLERAVGVTTPEKDQVQIHVTKAEDDAKFRTHKRSNSEDMTEKQRKGFLSRIRSNISGRMKGGSESPKHQMRTSPIPIHMMKETNEPRTRVTSISGKKMKSKGMGIVTFGDTSSESESEDVEDKLSIKGSPNRDGKGMPPSSPIHIKKHFDRDDRPATPESPVFHSLVTPVDIVKQKAKARIHSDSTQEVKTKKSVTSERRKSFLQEGTNMSGFIQAPPRGVNRSIFLDPDTKKFGFHLEKYDMKLEGNKTISRTIIQHVVPGSSAFVAGFFPGDQIMSVNGQNLEDASVQEIATAIQKANPNRRIEVVVKFVEGAIRVKKKKERGDLQIKLVEKQKNLGELVSIEQEHLRHSSRSPSSKSPLLDHVLPGDLSSWREDTPPEENSLHVFNYNRQINDILSLHHGDVTLLSCDMLVVPLQRVQSKFGTGDNVRDVLKAGGASLIDELSMANHCDLGDNIYTKGHGLPAKTVCHTVFGTQEDNIFRCCRQALKIAKQREYQTIVFWISGFISSSYTSPHHIICAIRGWLEEGVNCSIFNKLILSVPSTPAMISLIERYFPLEDYKLQDFLQDLNYVSSEDESSQTPSGTNMNTNSNKPINGTNGSESPSSPHGCKPVIPPRSPHRSHQCTTPPLTTPSPPLTTPSSTPVKSVPPNEQHNGAQTSPVLTTENRTKYVKIKFNEIDSILNDVNSQVASMKKRKPTPKH